ncbi:YkvA family protein [Phenylobacterium deserti]|uniref:DUF1232 domain-containing protein n=1 Tax=Phenylobacterium deserti TaxID=1914756 RepID=A0A328ARM9_9CAUL|nr:DUF1232 domain-containing protein [Phenylobacterium deserti]RAK57209.1 hypothetical protein DJ018_04460 [Phenylobacterium deserti]
MTLRTWARALKRDAHVVWLCARDPRTPWAAKAVALLVAAYAFSPLDLIPDFVPVLGYLDDLILVPAGLWLALKLIPAQLLAEHRAAAEAVAARPISRIAAGAVLAIWAAAAIATALRAWSAAT